MASIPVPAACHGRPFAMPWSLVNAQKAALAWAEVWTAGLRQVRHTPQAPPQLQPLPLGRRVSGSPRYVATTSWRLLGMGFNSQPFQAGTRCLRPLPHGIHGVLGLLLVQAGRSNSYITKLTSMFKPLQSWTCSATHDLHGRRCEQRLGLAFTIKLPGCASPHSISLPHVSLSTA